MSGAVGNLLGLAVAGIVSAAVGAKDVSAACIGSTLFLCLGVSDSSEASFVTTYLAFPVAIGLFIGVLVGPSDTTFLLVNVIQFLSTTGLYVIPRKRD